MLDLPSEAAQLAAQYNIPFNTPSEQPIPFLQQVWQVLLRTELVPLAAESMYIKNNIYKDVVQMQWLYTADTASYDLTWAHAANTRQYPLVGRGGIFWHGAARKETVLSRFMGRGSLDELTNVGCMWSDLDCEKHGYTLTQGMQVLLSMPLLPSIIVFSGGGLQAIHLLSEAWAVPNRESAKEYTAYSLALYRGPFNAAGIDLDTSVHEAARMMRLPGFVNRKPQRNGAVAQIIYWHPGNRYTHEQIKTYAPLPVYPPRSPSISLYLPTSKTKAGETLYRVSHEFIVYLIEGQIPINRHPTILALLMSAARGGIPLEDCLARARPVFYKWFDATGESHRSYDEIDRLAAWCYETVAQKPDSTTRGSYLVKLTDSGFVTATIDETEKANDQTVHLQQDPAFITKRETMDLETIRIEQNKVVGEYIESESLNKTIAHDHIGTYLLLRTSPGAGKTYTTWQMLQEYAEIWRKQSPIGGAAFFSLFKFDEHEWRKYVESFGVDPTPVYYFVERNGDKTSAGYCALHEQAHEVGNKGWIVRETLCRACQHRHVECPAEWYLSQKRKAEKQPILLARHQHAMINELMEDRRVMVFDESPLPVIVTPIVLKPDDFKYPYISNETTQDQFIDELTLLHMLIDNLRGITLSNPKPEKKKQITDAHLKLGGYSIINSLIKRLGVDKITTLFAIKDSVIDKLNRPNLGDMTIEAIATLSTNYLQHVWTILKYEYETYYTQGAKRWNSRIMIVGDHFKIYPMHPFTYAQATRIIITDATGQPELYGKAFAYEKTIDKVVHTHSRQAFIFEHELDPRAEVNLYTGTDNTRKTVRDSKKVEDKSKMIVDADGYTHPYYDVLEPIAIRQTKEMIRTLAEKHAGSLLVVTYKKEAEDLRKWAKKALPDFPPEQIQWFGGLRGKNDFEKLAACLLVGTPRIPPHEVLTLAQVWYWDDPIPIDATPLLRIEPYPNSDTGYKYIGYADDRVNAIYIHMIRAEMRQCYERIRPDASDTPRIVYLGSAFPAAPYVTQYISWAAWQVDHAMDQIFAAAQRTGDDLVEAVAIQQVVDTCQVSKTTARDSFNRSLDYWNTHATVYKVYDRVLKANVYNFEGTPGAKQSKIEQVKEWLAADPERLKTSDREIVAALKTAGIFVSRDTVQKAKMA